MTIFSLIVRSAHISSPPYLCQVLASSTFSYTPRTPTTCCSCDMPCTFLSHAHVSSIMPCLIKYYLFLKSWCNHRLPHTPPWFCSILVYFGCVLLYHSHPFMNHSSVKVEKAKTMASSSENFNLMIAFLKTSTEMEHVQTEQRGLNVRKLHFWGWNCPINFQNYF